jgi:hypothetical protein
MRLQAHHGYGPDQITIMDFKMNPFNMANPQQSGKDILNGLTVNNATNMLLENQQAITMDKAGQIAPLTPETVSERSQPSKSDSTQAASTKDDETGTSSRTSSRPTGAETSRQASRPSGAENMGTPFPRTPISERGRARQRELRRFDQRTH